MDLTSEVKVNLSLMTKYQREIPSKRGVVLKKWAIRYRAFIQRRWNQYSRGAGDWPPLKYRKGSILRDTNTMFSAMLPVLSPPAGSINNLSSDMMTIDVGFGGSATHPAGVPIAQLALWHQTGAGNLPVREIIVPPDESLLAQMKLDMKKEFDK
jgi:hypothetical protein